MVLSYQTVRRQTLMAAIGLTRRHDRQLNGAGELIFHPAAWLFRRVSWLTLGTLVVSGYETLLWDPKTRKPLGPPLEEDLSHAGPVAFSPTGHNFARVHTVRGRCWFDLWDLKTRKDQAGPESILSTAWPSAPMAASWPRQGMESSSMI